MQLNLDHPLARNLELCLVAGNRACRGSNTWLDLSPKRNHGTLTNMDPMTDWVSDSERAGVDFDGNLSQEVPTPYVHDLDKDVTVALVLKTNVLGASSLFAGYFGATTRFHMHAPYSNGKIYWDYGDVGVNGRVLVDWPNYSEWSLIVATAKADKSGAAVYIDGALAGSRSVSDKPTDMNTFTLGSRSGGYYWTGQIDMCLVASRAWRQPKLPSYTRQRRMEDTETSS